MNKKTVTNCHSSSLVMNPHKTTFKFKQYFETNRIIQFLEIIFLIITPNLLISFDE